MLPATSSLYVIIPVHNRKEYTRDCLNSLNRQTYQDFKIIVVDDGSVDGTGEMLMSEFPEVTVVLGDGNLFWTAAINKGVRYALSQNADYVLTLNNDTIAEENFVEKMMYWSSQKPQALLGAFDLDIKTKKPYYGGERVNWKWSKSDFLLDELSPNLFTGLHEVSLFPGRGLLIPRKVFDTIGLFEENKLPHYMADYDFTLMAKRNGFPVYCNYDAHLYTYPEEGGDHKTRSVKNLGNYFEHLFGIRGGGNLKNFTIYTFRNCPPKFLLPSLLVGYIRRIGGFWIK